MYLLVIQALLVQVLLIHSILYYLYTLYQMTYNVIHNDLTG